MRDDDDDAARVGEAAQGRHDLSVERGVETRGRFVEDEQGRACEQLQRHRCAFALPAGEAIDAGVGMLGQLQLVENPGDHHFTVGAGGVRWQPELCGITEGPPEGQLPMDDVVLRDHADTRAQYRVLGVHA